MTDSEFTSLLTRQLKRSSVSNRVDFALGICQRLLPEYIAFSNNHKWGDSAILQEAIKYCESNKSLQDIDLDKVKKLRIKIDPIIPDTEDFGGYDGSYALNASAAISELLEYFIDKDIKHILSISSYMMDTVDFKIYEEDATLTYEQLDQHPRMNQERAYQLELTKIMTDLTTVSWIFLAVSLASREHPASFQEISQIADGINHVVPNHKELQDSVAWLKANGLVVKTGSSYSLTDSGKEYARLAESKTLLDTWNKLEKTFSTI